MARRATGALSTRLLPAARAVAAHPTLWPTAVRQVFVLARRGWWHRPPFLPVPDAAYLRFRMQTAYGGSGDDRDPEPRDLLTYLRWCRDTRHIWRPPGAARN